MYKTLLKSPSLFPLHLLPLPPPPQSLDSPILNPSCPLLPCTPPHTHSPPALPPQPHPHPPRPSLPPLTRRSPQVRLQFLEVFLVDDQQIGDSQVQTDVHDERDDLKNLDLRRNHRGVWLFLCTNISLEIHVQVCEHAFIFSSGMLCALFQ